MRPARQQHLASGTSPQKIQSVTSSTPKATMNNYQQKTPDPRKKGGEHHGLQRRARLSRRRAVTDSTSAPGDTDSLPVERKSCRPPPPARTMKKKNNHQQLLRRNLMNTQRSQKETRTKFFSGHDGSAINVHELVANNNPSLQEWKEAARHSSAGHQ